MHREDPVSPTHQMYLKALYRLCRAHPVGRVRDLAEELGLTPGTVSTALNRLQELGLVEREHYGGALLTPSGSALAQCVERRYETLRVLLTQVFGVPGSDAESDACLMEHAVSPVTINRITRFLEHLEAGKSVSLHGLEHLYDESAVACSDCEAEGFCKAADSAVSNQAESR
jgi:DtxR family Mn-dependent transcriptional regulator